MNFKAVARTQGLLARALEVKGREQCMPLRGREILGGYPKVSLLNVNGMLASGPSAEEWDLNALFLGGRV